MQIPVKVQIKLYKRKTSALIDLYHPIYIGKFSKTLFKNTLFMIFLLGKIHESH